MTENFLMMNDPTEARRPGQDMEPTAAARHEPPGRLARVLLVLDRPALVELVKLTLNQGHYHLSTAGTAEEAVVRLDEWRPHLVIFDADMDGQKVMEFVLARAAGSSQMR